MSPEQVQWALDKLRRELVDTGVLEASDEDVSWLELEKRHRELWG